MGAFFNTDWTQALALVRLDSCKEHVVTTELRSLTFHSISIFIWWKSQGDNIWKVLWSIPNTCYSLIFPQDTHEEHKKYIVVCQERHVMNTYKVIRTLKETDFRILRMKIVMSLYILCVISNLVLIILWIRYYFAHLIFKGILYAWY